MNNDIMDFDGFKELENELNLLSKKVSDICDILEVGAQELIKDALRLPKPKSKIKSSKHTHLVDSFAYKRSKKNQIEIEAGWGVYYGPFVERGTKFMKKSPHLEPLFNKNKDKYYKKMLEKIY